MPSENSDLFEDLNPATESNPLERNIVVVRVQQLPEADNNDSNGKWIFFFFKFLSVDFT